MPIKPCTTDSGKPGWKWGDRGKCYPTKAQALKQADAIKASQNRKRKE